jgi:uncharacterized oligopeptide transporter (OPT) family protein
MSDPSSAAPRGRVIADPGDGPMYEPAPGELQLTVRAVLIGCVIGALIAAMNIRFGLKTGWSVGGSLIAAIMSYAFFQALGSRERPFTPLETNIAQTAGSAAGAMSSAAGLLSAVPAMQMLGYKLSYLELTLWATAVGWLGVFFAVPLRRQMVLVDKLRFPSGTATAATITAMFSSGADALLKARFLLGFSALAAVHTLAANFLPVLGTPPVHEWLPILILTAPAAYGFTLLISPMMTGAGFLIGTRTGVSLLIGATVAWGVLAPMVEAQGWVADPSATQSYAKGARGWILWPGVAIMVADALTGLALSAPTILRTFTGSAAVVEEVVDPAGDQEIPNTWWIGGLIFSTALTVFATWQLFGIPPHLSLFAVALSAVLSAIAVRSTGETDINPTGGMGKVVQLVFGGISPGQIQTNLMTAAITAAGASQAADMMQDLKTGHLLGASPRQQIIAQLAGIAAGIVVCVPIYIAFANNYEIGGEEYPAPAAMAWKAMAEVLTQGLGALPQHALAAVAGGLAFGALIPILRKFTGWTWLPSGLAIGVAFIVPAYYSVAMFVGGMIYLAWQRLAPSSAEMLGFSVASGLLAGEGLMGVAIILGTEFMRQFGSGA